jgi:segregation and condensation protein A
MILQRPKKEELIEEDPREELMRKLIEYKKIKYVSHELNDRQGQVTNYCFRNKEIDLEIPFEKPEVEEVLHGVSLQQLYEVFQGLIKENNLLQVEKDRQIDAQIIRKDTYTIAKKSEYLLNLLKVKGELSFFSLCQLGMPKIELIVTFMSVLELVHKKQVIIWQERPLDDIMIRGVTANEKN